MNRLVTMGGPLVLRRPDRLVPTQIVIGMQRPIRITQQLPGEEDDVGLTGTQNMLGLGWLGDHAYRAGGNARLFTYPLSKSGLITGPCRNLGVHRRTT